ncbi:Reticulon-domain-containing protein [Dichotomocladium elegans]|nr:Reticulon-domain-containing protein [Dichotomocladium elegans]
MTDFVKPSQTAIDANSPTGANTIQPESAAPETSHNSASSNGNLKETPTFVLNNDEPVTATPTSLPPLPLQLQPDTASAIGGWVHSILYWEKPAKSGTLLASSLGVLILTQYYSVLQLAAAAFTFVTGLNLLYVNAQKFVLGSHPHSNRIANGLSIPRDKVDRVAQHVVDIAEVVSQKLTRLVLIEDTATSAWSAAAAYLVWTVAAYVSAKYIIALFLVSAFSVPRLYAQNQELIDRHIEQQSQRAKLLAKQYGSTATMKAKELYGTAMASMTKSKAA